MPRETAQEIDRAAADWAARADRDLTPDEAEALELWLAGDERRVGAYGRMRALALQTQRARALTTPNAAGAFTERVSVSRPDRRRLLIGGGGALAASLVGLGVFGRAMQRQTFRSGLGEVRVVPLSDGSVITLNTASVLRVRFTKRRRDIELLEGEALFDVAPDSSRPFVVDAGGAQARAVGTSFTVRRLGEAPVEVLVREGVVAVMRHGRGEVETRVVADVRAIAPLDKARPIATVAVPPGVVGRELAWREGRLAFEGETLAQAADRFARYSDTRIVIDDPQIAAEEITGLFQANDPVGFAQAIASSFELHAEVGEGQVRLKR